MRAVLLLCSIGLVLLLVRSGPWLSATLAVYEDQTALEDSLDAFIQRELADKKLPSLAISLVNGQRVVFERGYGEAGEADDMADDAPATPYTVYRVGALSQAVTTIAVLERAERGALQLDAPVSTYIPSFAPQNPYGHPITIRQLLSHQSGLPREPHVGHYFDTSGPTLQHTVASLNETTVVYPPETFTKYSNAAFAIAGYVLESVQERPFEQHMRAVLDRMNLKRTSFAPRFDLRGKLAPGYHWTYDGRAVEAPLFEPGAMPALSLYTTANDLGRLIKVLFDGGRSPNGTILNPASLEEMWTLQPATARQETPYGLAFVVSERQGERRIYLGDSFHGYTSRLDALPDSKLGVAVVTNLANADAALERIAEYALALLAAERDERPLPAAPLTRPVDPALRDRLVGHYAGPAGELTLSMLAGELYACQDVRRTRLRQIGTDTLVTDDRHAYGTQVVRLADGSIVVGKETYAPSSPPQPSFLYSDLTTLTGIYANEAHALFVVERDQRLYTLVDWIRYFPLETVTPFVYAFPDEGMFGGETAVFDRDDEGRGTRVTLANMTFERIEDPAYPAPRTALRPPRRIEELLEESARARPPAEPPGLSSPDLVDIALVDPLLNLNILHATDENALQVPLYEEPRAFLQRPVADALFRVQERIRRQGYGLIIYDAYQPWFVTHTLWQAAPDSLRHFFDDPAIGSAKNRGCAIALNFYDLDSGIPMPMPTDVGGLSPLAAASYPLLDNRLRWNRDYLRFTMEAEGFAVHPYKWWLFEHRTCDAYPPMNDTFSAISASITVPTAPTEETVTP